MADFVAEVRKHAPYILKGIVLAIDPASGGTSLPGWACYKGGKLIQSGVLGIGGGPVQDRLRSLYDSLLPAEPDILVIEKIRGSKVHQHLHWSVGVAVAACRPVILLEMPVSTWKKYAGKEHVKSDENDAKAIGRALMIMAGGKAA